MTSSLESWRCREQQDGYGGRWRGRQKELRAETFIVKMIKHDEVWGGGTVRRKVKPRGGWPTVRGYSCTVWRPFDKSYLNYSFRLHQKFFIRNFCHRKYIRGNISQEKEMKSERKEDFFFYLDTTHDSESRAVKKKKNIPWILSIVWVLVFFFFALVIILPNLLQCHWNLITLLSYFMNIQICGWTKIKLRSTYLYNQFH